MLRILVAEDEPRQCLGIVRLLRELEPGAHIVETSNGLEALRVCEKSRFDVVITDIRMPKMDGIELLTELHSRDYGAYTVIVSAYEEFEHARKAIRLNVRDYLTKPFTKAAMRTLLDSAKKDAAKNLDQPLPKPPEERRPIDECMSYIARACFKSHKG